MSRKDRTGTEGFYLDENGVKQDADFHAEILDNPEADLFSRQQTARRVVESGHYTMAEACKSFGVEPWTDKLTVREWSAKVRPLPASWMVGIKS